MSWTKVMRDADLWEGETKKVTAGGRSVLVAREQGRVVAFEDRCPHLGVPLSEGKIEGGRVTCRAHGWSFSLETGQGINPSRERLCSIPVRVENGQIEIDPAVIERKVA